MRRISLVQALSHILVIALPVSGGRLLTVSSSFIAMMMVAQLGEVSFAAGFLATTSSTTILVLASSIFYAIAIRIRFYRGQNHAPVLIGAMVKNGLYLAILIGIPAAVIMASMDKMLLALGQDSQLVMRTHDYFYYAGLGMFPMLVMMVIGQFYVGIGRAHFTLITSLISLPLTCALSYAFILGQWGLPQLGLAGVSLANLLVQTGLVGGCFIVLITTGLYRNYPFFRHSYFMDWSVCKAVLALGVPIGAQAGGELVAMALGNYLMGYYGVDALAALQIPSQYSMIVIMLSFGLSQAMSCVVSESYGRGEVNKQVLKKYVYAAILLLLAYIIPVSIIFCFFATELAAFYMDTNHFHAQFLTLVHVFFALAVVFLFFDGMRTVLSSILRGLHDAKTATRINLFALWGISLVASYSIVFIFEGDPVMLRVGFLSGFVVATVVLAVYLGKKLIHSVDTPHQARDWAPQSVG